MDKKTDLYTDYSIQFRRTSEKLGIKTGDKIIKVNGKSITGKSISNKQIFNLNLQSFKKFCLRAGTKKSQEIHNYFIKEARVFKRLLLSLRRFLFSCCESL
jgi:phage anti-repressor protein